MSKKSGPPHFSWNTAEINPAKFVVIEVIWTIKLNIVPNV